MHILHLCTDYPYQKIYRELVAHLDALGVQQTVYVPLRDAAEAGRNEYAGSDRIRTIYSHVLRPHHRIFYGMKIRRLVEDVESKVDLGKVDVVNASFLFSEGEVARQLKEKYGIPYSTAVRNTDLNYFFTLRPDLRKTGRTILDEADAVVFLSEGYRNELMKKYLWGPQRQNLLAKSHIIPNGLEKFWFDNLYDLPRLRTDKAKLLYVGEFLPLKGVVTLLEVCRDLKTSVQLELTLVGGGGSHHQKVMDMLEKPEYSFVNYIPRVSDRAKLRDIYRSHDVFVMASRRETFGLVYLEALSQGLPIVYSEKAGIHGHVPPTSVGCAVNPDDESSIRGGILETINDLESISGSVTRFVEPFRWNRVADKHLNVLKSIRRTAGGETK